MQKVISIMKQLSVRARREILGRRLRRRLVARAIPNPVALALVEKRGPGRTKGCYNEGDHP
jgi:hypothetical protein